MISKLLRKNTSPARILGFVLSNLIGLAIIGAGLQFYLDARSLWQQDSSFLKSDYLAINKVIDASNTLGNQSSAFTEEDIRDLEAQPWVDKVGKFSKADFRVYAAVSLDGSNAGRNMSTAMFFEAVPDEYLDIKSGNFSWTPGQQDLPIIISKDYLALYNFGFANSAGLPQLSETLISGLPLRLTLSGEKASPIDMNGQIIGYSNRFNTILVPQSFIDYMNERYAGKSSSLPSRLIVDVNSPGDAAIAPYLEEKGWEVAGDKSASSATYMLKIVTGIIISVGSVITLLSLFILILSMSLLMEKNRRKLHSLMMLGYGTQQVARPYRNLTSAAGIAAGILAIIAIIALRSYYLAPLKALGASGASILPSILLIILLTAIIIAINQKAITRRVAGAWRI